jgi:hypothetical protein
VERIIKFLIWEEVNTMSTILDLQAIEPEQEVAEAARVSTISNEHCWGWPSAVTTRYC